MAWKGWEDVTHAQAQSGDFSNHAGAAPARQKRGVVPGADRGSRRGAHRVVVTEDRQVVEHQLAKNTGTKGTFFQSKREALRWVGLLIEQDAGVIRNLRRQVKFALQCKNAAGLTETVTHYTADFVYECAAGVVVEDVKPRGGLREDTYILKKKWFEAQYGLVILETH